MNYLMVIVTVNALGGVDSTTFERTTAEQCRPIIAELNLFPHVAAICVGPNGEYYGPRSANN